MIRMRVYCIMQAQDEECWISNFTTYINEDVEKPKAREAKVCDWIAPDYDDRL